MKDTGVLKEKHQTEERGIGDSVHVVSYDVDAQCKGQGVKRRPYVEGVRLASVRLHVQ